MLDLLSDGLPPADLALCHDCLVHLPLNLRCPPFDLPPPRRVLVEQCAERDGR